MNYLVFIDNQNATLINQRTEKGIWQNLYEFPVIETSDEATIEFVLDKIETDFRDKNIITVTIFNDKIIIHKLSHQKLHINFFEVRVATNLENSISLDTIENFPFPIVIFNFIQNFLK